MNSLDQCMERFERQVADQKCDQGANDNTDDPGLDQKRNLWGWWSGIDEAMMDEQDHNSVSEKCG